MQDESQPDQGLVQLIEEHRKPVFESWIRLQLESETSRLDLIAQRNLRAESEEFLNLWISAMKKSPLAVGSFLDRDSEAWRPVWEFLDRLSASRDQKGFTPTETAMFVLSLKQPLAELIQNQMPSDQQLNGIWQLTVVLDQLGLYTAEVYQKRKEELIARQRAEVEELSTPVVRLWEGILAMPLIGTLDTGRSQMVTATLLEAIAETGSEIAILDLTGVPTVDTRMAQHLMRTVAAARLMGAECILSGIRPQIAQTIVHLQIHLGDIRTEASLESALKAAFRAIGLTVDRGEAG